MAQFVTQIVDQFLIALEVVIASNNKKKKQVIYESADLVFHLLVLWKKLNIKKNDIAKELLRRKK